MPKKQYASSETIVTGIFWDALSAGSAVATLLRWGFADTDIEAVGLLEGRAPDLAGLLDTIGISSVDIAYYSSCFQDGAVLLIIHARPFSDRIALEIIRRHGAVLPPSHPTHSTTTR